MILRDLKDLIHVSGKLDHEASWNTIVFTVYFLVTNAYQGAPDIRSRIMHCKGFF